MTSSWKCLENVSEMSQSLCDHVTKRSVTERAGGGVCHPESKSKLCLFAFKSGSPEQTKIYLFAMGKSEGTSCPNDRAERYRSMQSRYRTRQTKIYLFAMGKSGGTSCSYLGTQNKRSNCLFWESGGTCRPMMQSISLCDYVTERDSGIRLGR